MRLFGSLHDRSRRLPQCAALLFVVPSLITGAPAARAREIAIRTTNIAASTPSPLIVLVSLGKQRVRIFDVNGEIASSRISSGRPGFDTPTGVFSILEKNQYHVSNIYSGAEMPFMQRITWSGIALHAGVVPGYRASHGCIRLPYSFARSLFGTTRVGNRVVVTGEETQPTPFNHPKLFKPLPLDQSSAIASKSAPEQQVAVNDQGDEAIDVNRLFGVTPALASAAALLPLPSQRRPTTRTEAERMMTDKLARLQASLKTAERARMSATEKAKVAVREAEAAKAKLDESRRQIESLRTAVSAAQKKQVDAVRAFSAFMVATQAPMAGARPAGVPAIGEDREFDLEDSILDATNEADAARARLARTELDFAAIQGAFTTADSTRQAEFEAVRQAQIDLKSAQTGLVDANKETVRRLKPVSVFISLSAQRIYVRQGFEPVLEAPITLNGPRGRFGTHVFTAMRYAPENPDVFDWRLVSAHTPTIAEMDDLDRSKRKKRREASPQGTTSNIRMAALALDSISIPQDVLAMITELARPGASLIVSDRDLPSRENGLGTEFVLLTR